MEDFYMEEEKRTYDQILEDLYKEHDIENLLSFCETDIQAKLFINSAKVYHYTEQYQKALNTYNTMCEFRDRLTGKLYNKYKHSNDALLTKAEIEKYYLPNDPELIKMNERIKKQKAYVDFYENVKKALEKQGWNFTTYLKTMTYGM
jgi:hypothetical protein